MRVVLLIGNAPNHIALSNKVANLYNVVGIVKETRIKKHNFKYKNIIEKIIERIFLSFIIRSWNYLQAYCKQRFPNLPNVQTLSVNNINEGEVYCFVKDKKPDLIIVSGTSIIKDKLLSIYTSIGILNLHTGISPYMKGGPNCTNWCIALRKPYLIGNTIMWIDNGIDSGNILTTEFTKLNGDENLKQIHIKVMEHAHELFLESIRYVADGGRQSIKQAYISKGCIFYNNQWKLKQKVILVKNLKYFKNIYKSSLVSSYRKGIKTIPLKTKKL